MTADADPMITAAVEALWPHLPSEVQDSCYEPAAITSWVAAAAAAALRVMADEIDRGPTTFLPPSVISALVRERADRLTGAEPETPEQSIATVDANLRAMGSEGLTGGSDG